MSDLTVCAQQCLSHAECRTATYYQDMKTCSLFSENSAVGQISAVANQASFVLSMASGQSAGEDVFPSSHVLNEQKIQ